MSEIAEWIFFLLVFPVSIVYVYIVDRRAGRGV